MSTAQVRIVPTPNTALKAHKKDFARVYVTFNSVTRPNSKNTVFNSGDVSVNDLQKVIARAVADLRATDFVIVS